MSFFLSHFYVSNIFNIIITVVVIIIIREAMKAIEKASDMRMAYLQTSPPELKMLKQVPVDAIFRGDMFSPFDAPLNLNGDNVPMLGDRVTNLTSVGVPFGLKGTVVIVHSSTGYVEVIFDEEFIGGRSLQGNCSQFRGRLCPWSGLLRIPNTQLKTQQQNSRSVSSAQINSYSVSSVKQTTNMPIQSNSGFNSHSSLASATVVLKSSSRPTSSVAASTPSVPVNTQQAAKLVSLLKGNKTDIVKNDAEQKGKRNEQVNPEKSKSILNMLNAPIATEKPIPVHQSESKTSLLKSALFSSTVAVDEEVEGQTGQVEVNATVELKSLLAVDTCEEVHIDGSVAVVSTSPVKKEKKATMLVPSKVQIKKKA